MIYNLELYNKEMGFSITIKNLSMDFLTLLQNEENIQNLFDTKWYMYAIYDKVKIINDLFMIVKTSKNNLVLLKL